MPQQQIVEYVLNNFLNYNFNYCAFCGACCSVNFFSRINSDFQSVPLKVSISVIVLFLHGKLNNLLGIKLNSVHSMV